MKRYSLFLACLIFSQPTTAAPKWLKAAAEHVTLGAAVYTGVGYAGGHNGQPNWKAGITAAGAVALAKELTDLHNHDEHPKAKVLLDIGEIMAGAGAAAAVKH